MSAEYSKVDKESFFKILEKCKGIVTNACDITGIARSTHYDWMASDPAYAKRVRSIREIVLDFAESNLHKQIDAGEVGATVFLLKCLGKAREYRERDHSEDNDNNQSGIVNNLINELATLKAEKLAKEIIDKTVSAKEDDKNGV